MPQFLDWYADEDHKESHANGPKYDACSEDVRAFLEVWETENAIEHQQNTGFRLNKVEDVKNFHCRKKFRERYHITYWKRAGMTS